MIRRVVFAHGKESGPRGIKIEALTQVARQAGWTTLAPDFSGIDDPRRRVELLLEAIPPADQLVLVGSSMGGYVVTAASRVLRPAGLFLMAPAFGMPGYPVEEANPEPVTEHCLVLHGWRDQVVKPPQVIAWAERFRTELLLVDDDHPLHQCLPLLQQRFAEFLQRLQPRPTRVSAPLFC